MCDKINIRSFIFFPANVLPPSVLTCQYYNTTLVQQIAKIIFKKYNNKATNLDKFNDFFISFLTCAFSFNTN